MMSSGSVSRRSAQSNSHSLTTTTSRTSSLKPSRAAKPPQPNNKMLGGGGLGGQLPQTPGSPPDVSQPVAALLQATAIPMPRKRGGPPGKPRNNVRSRRIRIADSSSPQLDKIHLDAFLSGADEQGCSEKSMVGDENCDFGTSVGSSLPASLLSLDNDDGDGDGDDDDLSTTLTSDTSSRSSGGVRAGLERKQKVVSSPEACLSDHPLQFDDSSSGNGSDSNDDDPKPALSVAGRLFDNPSTFRRFHTLTSTFRSNFSSSLRALRAAAHSVSNFATPSVWVDNTPDRDSVFHISPGLTDDKRPNLLNKTPSPALRRYLNPGTASAQSIQSYCKSSEGRHKPLFCTSSIQMQTYSPSSRPSRLVTHSLHASDESAVSSASPAPRHREPRENGDFLRMLVLEQSMRREGKVSPSQPRKAQVWLPARKSESYSRLCSAEMASVASTGGNKDIVSTRSGVPQRWVSLAVD